MVAIKAHEADRALAKPHADWRLILFYGPDSGLVSERATRFAKASVDDPGDGFQLIRFDGDDIAADPLRLIDEANTIGLFGNRRAIRISPTGKSLLPAVEPLLATPSRDAIVVIEAGDLQRTNPLRLACERARSALAVPCYGDAARDLGAIVDEMMRSAGKEIDRPARETLIGLLGGDRRVSRQEIEKLILYAGAAARIGQAEIEAIVGDTAQREVAMLVDAVFAGQPGVIDVAAAKLFSEGNDAGVMLGAVLRHALALARGRALIDSGRPARDAAGAMRLPFPRVAAAETALSVWTEPKLVEAITGLGAAVAAVRRDADLARPIFARTLWTLARMGRERPRSR